MTALLDRYRGDMIDSATLIGDNEHWWCVEVDSENPAEVSIVWTEALEFHVFHSPELLDGDDLRAGVTEALETELRRLMKHENVHAQRSDQDEVAVEVVVGLTVEPATVERLAELAWPFIATMTNVFDPGTFNAEYVMGNVARKVSES